MNSPSTYTDDRIEKFSAPKTTTLIYVFNPQGEMLLATKKTTQSGFDVSLEKVNTAGGKQESGETIEQCALRELEDEFGIIASEAALIPTGRIRFHFETKAHWDQDCHVYKIVDYTGSYKDSNEMVDISYYDTKNLPYEKMRESDRQRLPDMLAGKEIKDIFYHTDAGNVLARKPMENPDENTRLLLRTA